MLLSIIYTCGVMAVLLYSFMIYVWTSPFKIWKHRILAPVLTLVGIVCIIVLSGCLLFILTN